MKLFAFLMCGLLWPSGAQDPTFATLQFVPSGTTVVAAGNTPYTVLLTMSQLQISFTPTTTWQTGVERRLVITATPGTVFAVAPAAAVTIPTAFAGCSTATANWNPATLTITIPASCPAIVAGILQTGTIPSSIGAPAVPVLNANAAAPTAVSFAVTPSVGANALPVQNVFGYSVVAAPVAPATTLTSPTVSAVTITPSTAAGAALFTLSFTVTGATTIGSVNIISNMASWLTPTGASIVTTPLTNPGTVCTATATAPTATTPWIVTINPVGACVAPVAGTAVTFNIQAAAAGGGKLPPFAGLPATFSITTNLDTVPTLTQPFFTGFTTTAATAVGVTSLVPGSIQTGSSISPLVLTFRPATNMPINMFRTISITPNVPLFNPAGALFPVIPLFNPLFTSCAAGPTVAAAVPAGVPGAPAVLTVSIADTCNAITAGTVVTITFTNAVPPAIGLLLSNPTAGIPVVLSVTTNIDTAPVPVTYVSAAQQTVTSLGPVVPSTTSASTAAAQAKPSINLWFNPRDVMPGTAPRIITLVSSPIAIWDPAGVAAIVPVGGCTGTTAGTATTGGSVVISPANTLTITIPAGTTCQIAGNSLIAIPNTLVLANPTTNQDITIGLTTSLSSVVRTVYAYSVGATVGQITSITSVIPSTLAENAPLDSLTFSFTPATKLIAGNTITVYSNAAFTTTANIPTSIFTPSFNDMPASTTTTGCTLTGVTDVNARLTVTIVGTNCNIAAGSVFSFKVTGRLGSNPVAGTVVTFDISTSLDMRPLTTTAIQGYTTTAATPVASLGLSWTIASPTAIQVGQPVSSLIVTFAPLTEIGSTGARTITISTAPSVFTPNVVVNAPSIAILTPAGQDAGCGASGKTDSNGNVTLTFSTACTLAALSNYQINLGGLLATNPALQGTLQSIPIIVTLYTSTNSKARSVFGYNAIQPTATATAKQITSIGSIVPTSTVQGAVLNGITVSFTPSSPLANGSTISINSNNADPIFPLGASNIQVALSTGATACTATGATTAFRVLTITLRDGTGVCAVSGLTTLTVSGLNGVNPAQSGNAITFDISTSADNTPLSTTPAQSYSTTASSPPSAAQHLTPFAALFVTIMSWLLIA